ncbi:phosphoribosylformylglycinamidine cyclo-ligase (AIRS) (Phosphoribosyl-aminoimidazole synthetase) (AIR synthase) [Candidatus Methylomirabilis lanthanidiphila]|uniref:Phosphoribosylformylglycinamidine cyclo-ligase n=1 Tax=Candidatus Methylomirabilis lanthanidiphila TaxID=2211376 RepID=A0A564ZJH5_9BACT|nr:phosphoribosylformylglycinamidine cyclo-ligase [Candidatus Methylomirabilis lanthanidiphila]VUZ85454.1 phosphoribosylformylglycinamidine cyclo-ligase (AIRS) (Phosphoribosyl-aminoimidazole synthetase) (AIR synthase) [Candidatus Methylomirabilis lanthanidiphila]
MNNSEESASYRGAGVDVEREEQLLSRLIETATQTFAFVQGVGKPVLPIGFFANVIDLGHGMGLALSTDGVGTKLMVAQMMQKYDTVGIDCMAMNVNDVLCVGARPMAFLDYIAVQHANPDLINPLMLGLKEGARQAGVAICGGEIAQVREMLASEQEGWGCDLVGMCVGHVPLDRVIVGRSVTPGDVVIGIRSSGIHSNGLTLARQVLFAQNGYTVDTTFEELGRTLGEELLEPTIIYVPEVVEALARPLNIKGLAHITSDGLLNLLRLDTASHPVGYEIDQLPPIPPIFSLIQRSGGIPDCEMFQVFNMGIGFCVVIAESDAESFMEIVTRHGREALRIGRVVSDTEQKVVIRPRGLVGRGNQFFQV